MGLATMSKSESSFVECPQCKRQYPAGTWKCLHDGFLLPPADEDAPTEEPTELGDVSVGDVTNPRTAFMHVEELISTEQGNQPPVLEPTMEEISAPFKGAATAIIPKRGEDLQAAVAEVDQAVDAAIGKDTLKGDDLDEETAIVSRAALKAKDTRPSPPVAMPPPLPAAMPPPLPPPAPTPAPASAPPPAPPGVLEDPDAETFIQRGPLPGAAGAPTTPAPAPVEEDLDSETVVLNRDALKQAKAVDHDAETYVQRDGQQLVDHDAETYVQQDGVKLVDVEAETRVKPKVVGPRDAPAMGLVGSRLGDYSLVRLIHGGPLEWVYEAHNQLTGERAAARLVHPEVDVANPDAARHFFQDADTVNRIGHKNVVEIFEQHLDPTGHTYQITELLEGESLDSLTGRTGRVPVRRTVSILLQICAALKTAHGAMILHRDLVPENIFLTTRASRDDLVKVLNFGLAKLQDLLPPDRRLPRSPYSSPERVNGGPPKDPRSDIYSLGVILYRMLSGRLPFDEMDGVQPAADRADPPPIMDVSGEILPALNGVVMCCLSTNPNQRYPNVVSLEQALQTAVHGHSESPFAAVDQGQPVPDYHAAAMQPTMQVPSSGGRRLLTIIVAAFLTLTASAGGIWAVGRYWPQLTGTEKTAKASTAPTDEAEEDDTTPTTSSMPAADAAVSGGEPTEKPASADAPKDEPEDVAATGTEPVATSEPASKPKPPAASKPVVVARRPRKKRVKPKRRSQRPRRAKKPARTPAAKKPAKKGKKITSDAVKKDPFGD